MGLLSASGRGRPQATSRPPSRSRVSLLLFTQTIGGSESGPVAKQVLDEIASLNDKITVVEKNFVLDTEDRAEVHDRQERRRSSS